MSRLFVSSSIFLALLLLGSCAGVVGSSGTLEIRVTDAPITIGTDSITKVVVAISDVSVHTSSSVAEDAAGWSKIALANNTSLDLLTLQNDVNVVLGSQKLPAGHYQQLRFTVASAKLTFADGTTADVTIPSGIVRMNLDAKVEADKKYAVILDFDAQASLSKTGSTWRMAPPVVKVKEFTVVSAS